MPTQTSSAHFFLGWAKERIDEMDATLASLESKAVQMQAQTRIKADQFIAQMRKKRDEFQSTVKKQVEAGEPTWDSAKLRLATELKSFEAETRKYLETFGNGLEQQQAVFQSQATAQLNAWREAADKLHAAAKEFGIERRREIDATVSRMKSDAAAAEKSSRNSPGREQNPGRPSTPLWRKRALLSIAPIRPRGRRSNGLPVRLNSWTARRRACRRRISATSPRKAFATTTARWSRASPGSTASRCGDWRRNAWLMALANGS